LTDPTSTLYQASALKQNVPYWLFFKRYWRRLIGTFGTWFTLVSVSCIIGLKCSPAKAIHRIPCGCILWCNHRECRPWRYHDCHDRLAPFAGYSQHSRNTTGRLGDITCQPKISIMLGVPRLHRSWSDHRSRLYPRYPIHCCVRCPLRAVPDRRL
jgi:hypothetical protein